MTPIFDINYPYFSKIFLEQISSNPQFKIEFQAFAPKIFADIESFSTNSNCSCRSKIEVYINENKDNCFIFLNDFIKNHNLDIDFTYIESKYKVTNYSGKIITVKKNQWELFVTNLQRERALFRTISIVPLTPDSIEVYFL
jgi:hypothetical protein